MKKTSQYSKDLMEYDLWLEKKSVVFDSELAAIREVLPKAEKISGIEVG